MTIRVSNQSDAAQAFRKYGKPIEITSAVSSYGAYESDSENDLFDEAMRILHCAKSIVLVFEKA